VDKNANLPSAMLMGNNLTPTASVTTGSCTVTVTPALWGLDDAYTDYQLALTDYLFTLTDSPSTPASGMYTLGVVGTFNYVDTNASAVGNLQAVWNYGLLATTGKCD
jgi:hypothetical protein